MPIEIVDNSEEESQDPLETGSQDPFHPDNVGAFNSVILMRIYDVLMLNLRNVNPTHAEELHNIHASGQVVGSWPTLDLEADE